MTTEYFVVKYDTEASGPYVAEGANLTWPGGVGFIVTLVDDGLTGKLFCALVSGVQPTDAQVLTQGSTTSNADGDADTLLFPAYFRNDTAIAGNGAVTWTGPALGVTHSFFFDGQTVNCVVGEILTFVDGQQCEVITIESDAGASGEFSVRWMSFIDQPFPADNDTFTGDIAGDGALNGVVHDRCYTPLHEHRLLSYLNTNGDIVGDDDLSRVDAIPSGKDTPEIVNLTSNINNSDEVIQHMYAGSISQVLADGETLYSGLNLTVTSPLATSRPVVILDDSIVTDYWKDAYMPHSIDGNVRILVKTREDGVDIDGKRVKAKLLELGYFYFEAGTTLGTGTTGLALVADTDGNNGTLEATLLGAPYNTMVGTEGYQLLDYLDGSGATPFGYSSDYGSMSSAKQAYERSKYDQRRGTAEILFGRNAQLYSGVNRNWPYDAQSGTYTQSEILAWGTEIVYSAQATNLILGEAVNFVGSGAKGRLIYMDDNGATGTLIFAMEGSIIPLATDTLSGITSGGDGDVDTVVYNAIFGTALLIATEDLAAAAGNHWVQILTGLTPIDNQEIYGSTSNAVNSVNGSPSSRTINKQYMGDFTGTNFQTLFGMATDPSDAIVNDIERNLLGAEIGPPDNQTGTFASLKAGDTAICYPWDGVTLDSNGDPEPDYNEQVLATALTGASTQIDVGTGNIPDNTPGAGFLRVERDSDNNLDYVEYSSHNGDDIYILVGTAPSIAGIGNTVMRSLFEVVMVADGSATYNAIYSGTPNNVVLLVKNPAGANGPIKANASPATFGASGFNVNASRIDDA